MLSHDPPARVEFTVATPGVAVLTFHGSNKLTMFDTDMRDSLLAALSVVAAHDELRAVLLQTAGEHFSAGADLSQFSSADNQFQARWIRQRRDPFIRIWELDVLVVSALRGLVLGSGFELALLGDIRLAHPQAKMGLPEARIGMLPGAGGTQSLARAIGVSRALPMVLTGRIVTAGEALRLGIVSDVTNDVEAAALRMLGPVADLPRPAVVAAKRALRAAADESLATGLRTERRLARWLTTGR